MQDSLEYRTRIRPLDVITLDKLVTVIPVDDGQSVQRITQSVCSKLGNILLHVYMSVCQYTWKLLKVRGGGGGGGAGLGMEWGTVSISFPAFVTMHAIHGIVLSFTSITIHIKLYTRSLPWH